MSHKQSDALERVMDLVRFLRTHCPWDAAQTPRSLIPYLLEEAHESADAISEGDDDALRSELGDLLLNIAFQLVLGEERGAFDAQAAADAVIDKMQRRHPHLYGLGEKEDWETLKARERDTAVSDTAASLLQGVARGLDPLSKAHRIQDRVAAVGFDWDNATGAFEKVAEELEEVREQLQQLQQLQEPPQQDDPSASPTSPTPPTSNAHPSEPDDAPRPETAADTVGAAVAATESNLEEELGDLLFAVVNLARLAGAHALTALQRANGKFTRRFQELERLASDRGVDLEAANLDELEALWNEVKTGEASG